MTSPWYEQVSAATRLTQGDIVRNCPVLVWRDSPAPRLKEGQVEQTLKGLADAIRVDVVVMSQACDLEHDKISNVVLCPCVTLSEYKRRWEQAMQDAGQNPTDKAWRRHCDDISDGFAWNLAILNACSDENVTTDHLLVDFHEVFSVPRSFLESFIKEKGEKRLRLRPPYREHLSQAFARFFMRVGLPTPVEKAW